MGKVNFDALTKDAKTWDQVSTDLKTASGAVGAVDISRSAFSFAALDVFDTYAQVRQHVIDLLTAGATEADGGAAALLAIRTTLEANESAAVSEFGGMWTPKAI